MNASRNLGTCLAVLGLALSAVPQVEAVPITYNTRAVFESQLGAMFTDDYSAAGYASGDVIHNPLIDIHSDPHMSAVLGETRYTTTGFSNWNIIQQSGDPNYCAGCNGSFLLDFTSTSYGSASGVFGAGFDNRGPYTDYFAFVTFGDGSTGNYSLHGLSFWGVTSHAGVKTVHVGLAGGGATTAGSIAIDNLTIGTVPEPTTLALLGVGLVALRARRRRTS